MDSEIKVSRKILSTAGEFLVEYAEAMNRLKDSDSDMDEAAERIAIDLHERVFANGDYGSLNPEDDEPEVTQPATAIVLMAIRAVGLNVDFDGKVERA